METLRVKPPLEPAALEAVLRRLEEVNPLERSPVAASTEAPFRWRGTLAEALEALELEGLLLPEDPAARLFECWNCNGLGKAYAIKNGGRVAESCRACANRGLRPNLRKLSEALAWAALGVPAILKAEALLGELRTRMGLPGAPCAWRGWNSSMWVRRCTMRASRQGPSVMGNPTVLRKLPPREFAEKVSAALLAERGVPTVLTSGDRMTPEQKKWLPVLEDLSAMGLLVKGYGTASHLLCLDYGTPVLRLP